MTKEEVLAKVKKDYPTGTGYTSANSKSMYEIKPEAQYIMNPMGDVQDPAGGYLYYASRWAKIEYHLTPKNIDVLFPIY